MRRGAFSRFLLLPDGVSCASAPKSTRYASVAKPYTFGTARQPALAVARLDEDEVMMR